MGIPRMFKTYKPKQFNFIPRYYDERKEALNNRIRQIENEMGTSKDKSDYKPSLTRGSLRHGFSDRRKIEKGSTIHLLVIVALLLIIATYLIYM